MALEDTLRHPTAAGIFDAVPKMAKNIEARPAGEDALPFMRALRDGPTPEEAMVFAAHMLLPRLSVWWGHECLQANANLLEPQDTEMLELAAAWVGDPCEDTRYAALNAANAAEQKTPGTWIALGAGWSGGSLAPQGFDAAPPDPVLCGRAVYTATLYLLARVPQPDRAKKIGDMVGMAEILATS